MGVIKKLKRGLGKKLLTTFLIFTVSLISYNTSIAPEIAGGAGASTVAYVSSGAVRWGLDAVKARDAWKVTRGSDEVVVAVIDSGIDRSVPAIAKHTWDNDDEVPADGKDNDDNGYVDDVSGWDFCSDRPLQDRGRLHYHGTFVSGLIASSYDRKTGAGGVAPNVSLMDLRFLDSAGKFYTSDWNKLADAIDYAVENGADIINMSIYASITPPQEVRQALQRAESEGVLIVGITGNEGDRIGYFGSWDEVFAVGAVNRYREVTNFSNYGPEVELVAPGAGVLSLKPGGKVAKGSGTSFAAPHVTGSAALILSKKPNMELSELKRILRKSAHDLGSPGKDNYAGYGIIDTHESLNKIIGNVPSDDSLASNGDYEMTRGEKVDVGKIPVSVELPAKASNSFVTSRDI